MTDEKTPEVEMVIELPELSDGPVALPDGSLVKVGDKVSHDEFGTGTIYRVANYHDDLGVLLCVEFPNGIEKMLSVDFVKKV
jgi:hypothetical protein